MIAAIGLFALYLLTVTFFIHDLNDRMRAFVKLLITSDNTVEYLVIGVSVFLLYIGSGFVSLRIYTKKLF